MSWSRRFDEPIALREGGEIRTLLDAGRYIEARPKAKHERSEWQTAMRMLLRRPRAGDVRAHRADEGAARGQAERGTCATTQACQEISGDPMKTVWIYLHAAYPDART